jgi:hypothetical protein
MTRQTVRVKKLVERPIYEVHETLIINCDKCGRRLDEEADDDMLANVLEIYCNLDQCVSDRVRLDLCTECLKPIWSKICEAIGADPNDELRIGQDEDR